MFWLVMWELNGYKNTHTHTHHSHTYITYMHTHNVLAHIQMYTHTHTHLPHAHNRLHKHLYYKKRLATTLVAVCYSFLCTTLITRVKPSPRLTGCLISHSHRLGQSQIYHMEVHTLHVIILSQIRGTKCPLRSDQVHKRQSHLGT